MHDDRRPIYVERLVEELLRASCHQHQILHQLLERTEELMALTQETRDMIAAFAAETTRLAELIGSINFDQDETEVRAELDPILNQLRAIGTNPAQPIPPFEPA